MLEDSGITPCQQCVEGVVIKFFRAQFTKGSRVNQPLILFCMAASTGVRKIWQTVVGEYAIELFDRCIERWIKLRWLFVDAVRFHRRSGTRDLGRAFSPLAIFPRYPRATP
jgi:hypothetical protein